MKGENTSVQTHVVGGDQGVMLKGEEERIRRRDLQATPRRPFAFQVLPAAQSGSEASGDGELGQAESGTASQALDGARRKRAASEGSLPPTGRAALAPSGAVGTAREGEITSAKTRAVGEGRGVMLKGEEERIRRRDLQVT